MAKAPKPSQKTAEICRTRCLDDEGVPRCERCYRSIVNYPASKQHRKPRGTGNANREPWVNLPANLPIVCGSATTPDGCHLWMETHREEAKRTGWLISGDQHTATEIPIIDIHGNAFVLDNYGTKIPVAADMYKDVLG